MIIYNGKVMKAKTWQYVLIIYGFGFVQNVILMVGVA